MYHFIVRRIVRRSFDHLNQRNYPPVVAMFHPQAHHVFAGDHALGGERHDSAAIGRWYARLFGVFQTLRFDVHDVVVQGLPWNTRVAVQFAVQSTLPDGQIYTNEVSQVIRLQWGKITRMWLYEDTQKLIDGLRVIAAHGNPEATATPITA